jgi:hypothetical protein
MYVQRYRGERKRAKRVENWILVEMPKPKDQISPDSNDVQLIFVYE